MQRWFWLLAALLLTGCATAGGYKFPEAPTLQAALETQVSKPVTISQIQPFGQEKKVVLFRPTGYPGHSAALLARAGQNGWRLASGVGVNGRLPVTGPLTITRANIGEVRYQENGRTLLRPEASVVFGELLDPATTWVELTLHEEGAQPVRAYLEGGTWLVVLDPRYHETGFDLRAGNAAGEQVKTSWGVR